MCLVIGKVRAKVKPSKTMENSMLKVEIYFDSFQTHVLKQIRFLYKRRLFILITTLKFSFLHPYTSQITCRENFFVHHFVYCLELQPVVVLIS